MITDEQMIKTAKRLLKPEFHDGFEIGYQFVTVGLEKYKSKVVFYNNRENWLTRAFLEMNCVDY